MTRQAESQFGCVPLWSVAVARFCGPICGPYGLWPARAGLCGPHEPQAAESCGSGRTTVFNGVKKPEAGVTDEPGSGCLE